MAERYSRATRSDDLELKSIETGDVDHLIAAGLVRETLATRLIRLRAEFDSMGRNRSAMRLLLSFRDSREGIVELAVAQAPARSTVDSEQAADIAMRVLDLFLDPTCPPCSGRGFTGGYGLPTIRCVDCRETGKRQAFWKTEQQEAFAKWLGSCIEGKVDRALADMRLILKELPRMKRFVENRD